MADHPRLLAMTATGDVVFAEDGAGQIWLSEALSEDGPLLVDAGAVDDAVAKHHLTRVDRSFDSWEELDDFRVQQAEAFLQRFAPRPHDLTADDVRRGLRQIERRIRKRERPIARRLALHLLDLDVVRLDETLHREVVRALDAATTPSGTTWLGQPAPPSERAVRARERVRNRWEAAEAA